MRNAGEQFKVRTGLELSGSARIPHPPLRDTLSPGEGIWRLPRRLRRLAMTHLCNAKQEFSVRKAHTITVDYLSGSIPINDTLSGNGILAGGAIMGKM